MELTISIVTHNNKALLAACLDSVRTEIESGIAAEIFAVVNVPGDGSADMIRTRFPEVRVIENETPRGFSDNHNTVLRQAEGGRVLLLNDDTVLHPGCLRAMMRFLDDHPDAGAVGPRILNPDGSLQQSCYRLPTLSVLFHDAVFLSSVFPRSTAIGGYKKWPHDTAAEVGHVIGACMMIPRAVLDRVGLLDEVFYLYFEEADLSKRMAGAGYKIYFTPEAEITHHGGASIAQLGPEQLNHFLTSMNRYYAKHFGRSALIGVYACNMAGAAARILIFEALALTSSSFRNDSIDKRKHFKNKLAWYLKRLPPK